MFIQIPLWDSMVISWALLLGSDIMHKRARYHYLQGHMVLNVKSCFRFSENSLHKLVIKSLQGMDLGDREAFCFIVF